MITATIDLTRYSSEYLKAAKPRWKALSVDHKFRKQVGGFYFWDRSLRRRYDRGLEIDIVANLRDSTVVIASYFPRAYDAGSDVADAELRLPLDVVPTNPLKAYKDFVAANRQAKWLIPVYGRVFRRSYREFISLFLPPQPH